MSKPGSRPDESRPLRIIITPTDHAEEAEEFLRDMFDEEEEDDGSEAAREFNGFYLDLI